MKISYLVPLWHNIGDKIVWLGAKSQYEKLYPDAEHELWFQNYAPTGPLKTDLFVVVGTPWLWDMCTRSDKYKKFVKYLEHVKCDRREAVGIGANYQLDWIGKKWLAFQHTWQCVEMIDIWSKFNSITVRDPYAKTIFDILNIPCTLERCPAFNTTQALGIKHKEGKNNLLVFYNLMKGIGSEVFRLDLASKWVHLLMDAMKRYDIKRVISVHQEDTNLAESLGLTVETYLEPDLKSMHKDNVVTLLNVIADANIVVTPRVHLAIPALTLKKKTLLIPIDSRYLTAVGATNYYDENKDIPIVK